MSIPIKTKLKITLVIGVVSLLGFNVVWGNSFGTTFATNNGTGALELKIDSRTIYNGELQPALSWELKNLVPTQDKFFNFLDVKPGDTGLNTISLHLKNNPAWLCLDFKNLTDEENGRNEPESLLDNNDDGELSEELEFFAWHDDGDNVFEVGEEPIFGTSSQKAIGVLKNKTYPLADSLHGGAYQPNQTNYIGIEWCAGDLDVNLATAEISCDAEAMGNEAQTDSMTLDVSIRAVSSIQQPNFSCQKPHPPTPVGQCEIEGHKYDETGKPLSGWTIGLMKVITHNNGVDIYDLTTDVTDTDGYYCLEWDGYTRVPRNIPSYINGPYNFTYRVFEILKPDWSNVSVEKGPNVPSLVVVPDGEIEVDGQYVSVPMGVPNGYIYADAAYHVDFYNQSGPLTYEKPVWQKKESKRVAKVKKARKNLANNWNKLKNRFRL